MNDGGSYTDRGNFSSCGGGVCRAGRGQVVHTAALEPTSTRPGRLRHGGSWKWIDINARMPGFAGPGAARHCARVSARLWAGRTACRPTAASPVFGMTDDRTAYQTAVEAKSGPASYRVGRRQSRRVAHLLWIPDGRSGHARRDRRHERFRPERDVQGDHGGQRVHPEHRSARPRGDPRAGRFAEPPDFCARCPPSDSIAASVPASPLTRPKLPGRPPPAADYSNQTASKVRMSARPAPLPSSRGAARLSFRRAGSPGHGWRGLHQSGSAKAFVHPSVAGPDVGFLNTSGGMTKGATDCPVCADIGRGAGSRPRRRPPNAPIAARAVAEVEVRHDLG